MWNQALRLVSPEKEDLALMLDLLAAIRDPMNANVGDTHAMSHAIETGRDGAHGTVSDGVSDSMDMLLSRVAGNGMKWTVSRLGFNEQMM